MFFSHNRYSKSLSYLVVEWEMDQSLCAFRLTAGLGWVSPQELINHVSCLFKSEAILFNQSSISSQSPRLHCPDPKVHSIYPKSAPDSQFTPCKKARFCSFIIRGNDSVKLLSDKCSDSSLAACYSCFFLLRLLLKAKWKPFTWCRHWVSLTFRLCVCMCAYAQRASVLLRCPRCAWVLGWNSPLPFLSLASHQRAQHTSFWSFYVFCQSTILSHSTLLLSGRPRSQSTGEIPCTTAWSGGLGLRMASEPWGWCWGLVGSLWRSGIELQPSLPPHH